MSPGSETTPPRLVQGRVSLGLLRLTAPMLLGITASIAAGLLEAFLLARVGTAELAAYSFTFPVTGALMSLSLGISIGLSSVLARTVGRGDQDQVRRLASDGISLVTLVMLTVSLVGWLTIEPLFSALGADATTLPLIVNYMSITYVSMVFMAVPSVGANAMRATGDASISGTIMVSGSLLHMALSPFLILGLMGLPAMGLEGAAWANFIARVAICIITLSVLHYREHVYHLGNYSADGEEWQELLNWKRLLGGE